MNEAKTKGNNQYIERVKEDRKGRDERGGQDKAILSKRCEKRKLGGGVLQQFEERILINNADLGGLEIS